MFLISLSDSVTEMTLVAKHARAFKELAAHYFFRALFLFFSLLLAFLLACQALFIDDVHHPSKNTSGMLFGGIDDVE